MTLRVSEPLDVLIRGGRIIDGSGNPWFRGDVGVRGGRIVAVGALGSATARTTLDAAGLVVAPGFIDAHVHGDLALFLDPAHEPAIRQGVTTYLIGQDGVAMAPASPATLDYMCRYTAGFSAGAEWLRRPAAERPSWSNMADYLACFDGAGAVNVACLVPNGNVRMEVMGLATRRPTADELARMSRLVREAMEQGAVGLSSGLDYIPSLYAEEAELAELCRAIAPYGGVYVTHMRRYDPAGVADSMGEVFRIGRDAGVPVHISHFNSQAARVLPLVDRSWRDGVEMTYDLYCYLYSSSILGMVALPAWVQEGGPAPTLARLRDPAVRARLAAEWFPRPTRPLETVRLSYVAADEYRHLEGKTLAEAAGNGTIGDLVCDLSIASGLAAGCVLPHQNRVEQDTRDLMCHRAMMGGSDGIFTGRFPHPRGCGCYARYLGHYVREGVWSLETAVQRLSSHPAGRFSLRDRGLLRPGLAADVVVFDADALADRATLDDGARLAAGMVHVLVNGELVLHRGERTAARPGRGLRRG